MNGEERTEAAAWTVLESAAELVAARSPRLSLDEASDRLGIDADRVRDRAAALRRIERRDEE